MNITAAILVKNEEKNIKKCIDSVKWCNEIIVMDDLSDDKTTKIAQKMGAQVLSRKVDGDFSEQRNFALQKAKNPWVFFVDADEIVSDALAFEIQTMLENQSSLVGGYCVKRWDVMWGKLLKHGEIGKVRLLRLGKKENSHWIGKVHETWEISGKKGELINPLLHYPHPTLTEFLHKVNMYSSLRAQELYADKESVTWWEIILYPKAKFFLNYFFRFGFLDGIQGLVIALIMSLHSFLVRGKLWQLQHQK